MATHLTRMVAIGACLLSGCSIIPGGARREESYEQLFMGFRRPFAERGREPRPASTPEGTVKSLYADEIFFHLRNSFPEPVTRHFQACFTPSLVDHFARSRRRIAGWLADKSHRNMKLPMGEGIIFLSSEAESFRTQPATIIGDTATVPVILTHRMSFLKVDRWTDVAILRRVAGVWLLDDIKHPEGYTLRRRTSIYGDDR